MSGVEPISSEARGIALTLAEDIIAGRVGSRQIFGGDIALLARALVYSMVHAVADETAGLIAEARAESAAWAVECAEMRAEVERLKAFEQESCFAADEIEALRADLGHVDPAEEPTEVVTTGIAYQGAYMRCECCGVDIVRGETMAIWRDSNGRLIAFAHAGPCPAPEL